MAGQNIDANFVYNRFVALVSSQVSIPAYTAVWSSAARPVATPLPRVEFGYEGLGPPGEPVFAVGELQVVQGNPITTVVYHRLYLMALRLTRVRPASYYYTYATYVLQPGGTQRTAFSYSIYFPMPAIPGATAALPSGLGQVIADGPTPPASTQPAAEQLDTFLISLRTAIINIRTNTSPHILATHCHTSCHSSCHGSRGRR